MEEKKRNHLKTNMAEQLPIITKSNAVTASEKPASSLLGRGLAAIQNKKTDIALSDLDSRYRQARDIYNRLTAYGEETRFNIELLPTPEQLLEEPLLQQLQPFYNQIRKLAEIFTVFQELADQGYGRAYFPLYLMYEGGQGIDIDIEKSAYYWNMAYDWCDQNQILNEVEIWTDLGWIFEHGLKDIILEDTQYSDFIKENYDSMPMNLYAWYESSWNSDDDQYRTIGVGAMLYCKAANKGYARAQYLMGLYDEYSAYSDQDCEKAGLWYREAAEKGYAQAQYSLGWMYEDGLGVEQDVDTAMSWYYKAALQGYAAAEYQLGKLYESCEQGLGFFQDDEEAVSHYQNAAKQGYAKAQYELGVNYQHGIGIEQDKKMAVFWCNQAAQSNLVQFINRYRTNQEMNYCLTELNNCDICGGSLKGQRFVIDGMVGQQNSSGAWAYMCATCFASHGAGIGWGEGQLYERTQDNEWLQVAGFSPLD